MCWGKMAVKPSYHLRHYKGSAMPWRIYDENDLPTGHEYEEDDPLDDAYELMGDGFDGRVIGVVVGRPGEFVGKVRELMEENDG
jgi:DUF2075 family protein